TSATHRHGTSPGRQRPTPGSARPATRAARSPDSACTAVESGVLPHANGRSVTCRGVREAGSRSGTGPLLAPQIRSPHHRADPFAHAALVEPFVGGDVRPVALYLVEQASQFGHVLRTECVQNPGYLFGGVVGFQRGVGDHLYQSAVVQLDGGVAVEVL